MHGEAADPVVVSEEGVEVLSGLRQEELDQLVPACREDEGLVVRGHSIGALLGELFQCGHSDLGGEFMLEKLGVHEFG